MNKQSSHHHFSFKPKRHPNPNTSFSSCQTIEYDTIISNILSEAEIPKHILSSKQVSMKTINLESSISTNTLQSPNSNTRNPKATIAISPLTRNDSHPHIKNIKVVSYIKPKTIPQTAKNIKTIPFFANAKKTMHSKQRLNIPKPKTETNNSNKMNKTTKTHNSNNKQQKLININVNVFIQSSALTSSLKGVQQHNPLKGNKNKSMSSLSLTKQLPVDNNKEALGTDKTLRRQCKNLSQERYKRSLSKKNIEEQTLEQIGHKIDGMYNSNSMRSYDSSTCDIHKENNNSKIINKLRTKKRLVLQRVNEVFMCTSKYVI